MTEDKFNPDDMPILDLNTSGTSRYEASRFLDRPEVISAYAESVKVDAIEGEHQYPSERSKSFPDKTSLLAFLDFANPIAVSYQYMGNSYHLTYRGSGE